MLSIRNTKGHYVLFLAGKVHLAKAVVERSWAPTWTSIFGCSRGRQQWHVRVIAELYAGDEKRFHEHLIEAESFDEAAEMVDRLYLDQVQHEDQHLSDDAVLLPKAAAPVQTREQPLEPPATEAVVVPSGDVSENDSDDEADDGSDDDESDDEADEEESTSSDESSELSLARVRTEF